MKTMGLLAAAIAVAALAGCSSNSDQQQTTPAVSDSAMTQVQIDRIAGDKNLMVEVMKRAYDKGTLDDAIELSMSDSTFASQVMAMVATNPNLSALFASNGTKGAATQAARKRVASVAAQRGDALDRTEQSMQKANAKIDQAGRIKDQATDAKHKIDVILKP